MSPAAREELSTSLILAAVTALTLIILLPQLQVPLCPMSGEMGPPERELLEAVNQYRAAQAVALLTADPALTRSAQLMAVELTRSANLAHIDSQGRDLVSRAYLCGLGNVDQGEVLAQGYILPSEALAGWQASPAHNRVLLNPIYTQAGVARRWSPWRNQSSVPYWVLELSN